MNYRDREGKEYIVDTSQDRFLRFLYTNRLGRSLLKVMISEQVTNFIEFYMNTRLSTLKIDGFIKKNNIRISDY